MKQNRSPIEKIEQLIQDARASISELTERREALFAELVAEGEKVQKRFESDWKARRKELETRISQLRQRTEAIDRLRKRLEKLAANLRDQASERIETVTDRVQNLRNRAEDRAEDLRDTARNPVRWLYGQLNLATSRDLEQIKRQISALRIRVAALKAA